MEVEGIGDGESDLVGAIRQVVGDHTPIAASLDLHANVAPKLAENANILTAFRTSPHRDDRPTRHRAVRHLLRAIEEGLQPETVLIKIPLLIPGEYALTDSEPAKSLYERLSGIESQPGIMDASLLIGCLQSDSPYSSVSVLVVSETKGSDAPRLAAELASEIWERRSEFGPSLEEAEPEDAIARALAEPEGPILMDDTGDNFTAGAAADVPVLLRLLLEADVSDAVLAGLVDPQAVEQCVKAGIGASLSLKLGGKRDQVHASPLAVKGTVVNLYPAEQPQWAIVQVGGVQVILTSEHAAFFGPGAFTQVGIDPLKAKIIAVKHIFPGMAEVARRSIYALTPGFTDWHLHRRPFKNIRRPIYPLDPEMEWSPND
jgi:microcystin degradation protein MlrC